MALKNITFALVLFGLTLAAEEAAGSIPPFGPGKELSAQTEGKLEETANLSQTIAKESAPDSLLASRRSSSLRNDSKRSGRTTGNTRKTLNRRDNRINDYSSRSSRISQNSDRTRSQIKSGKTFGGNRNGERYHLNKRNSRSFEFITPAPKPSAN